MSAQTADPRSSEERAIVLLDKLKRLAAVDPQQTAFGVSTYHHVTSPMTEDEVRAFERLHAIELPPDYRAWIRLAGVGLATSGLTLWDGDDVSLEERRMRWRERYEHVTAGAAHRPKLENP